jgi:hypothetical protein
MVRFGVICPKPDHVPNLPRHIWDMVLFQIHPGGFGTRSDLVSYIPNPFMSQIYLDGFGIKRESDESGDEYAPNEMLME